MVILGISGSLRADSHNGRLLDAAGREMPAGVRFEVWDGLRDVPPYDEDLDTPEPPAEVARLRDAIARADALLIATPEYAHGWPGVLKNALDWLVGSGDLYGKRVAIMSAAPDAARAVHARDDLERTLRAQGADVVSSETIAVPTGMRGHEADDQTVVVGVDRALEALA